MVADGERTSADTTPKIRPATAKDAKRIMDIYNEAVRTTTATFDTEPRSLAGQIVWLKEHGAQHPVLVAEWQGRVAGWAALSPWSERPAYSGTAEISVYVGSQWRNRGIGSALMREILQAAQRVGLHTILARIAEGNPVSRRLHVAAGFASAGRMHEVGYKFGRFLDVELMELPLAAPQSSR